MPVLAELRLTLRTQANTTLAALNDATPAFRHLPLFTRLYFNAKAIVEAAAQCVISGVELIDALVRHQEYHVSTALHTGASILSPARRGVVQSRLELEQHTSLLCAACETFTLFMSEAPQLTDRPELEGCVQRLAQVAKERVAAVDLFLRSSPLFVAGVADDE